MEIDASIGNIIAGNNRKNIIKVYWELFSARFISAAIITFCTYLLAPSFITLWLGAEYLLSNNIFIIICLTLFIDQCRSISEKFLWGYGIFNDAKFALCEAVIGIALSILGGYLWGIIGVIAGPLVPGGIMFIFWKPWLLFREGFRLPTKYYFLNLFKYIVIFIFSAYITICLPINNIVQINSYYDWLLQAIYQFVCYSSILIFLLYIFTPGTKDIVERVKLTMNAKIQNLRHKIFTGS